MKCTFKELTLENGEVIKLTLNFARLLQLKNKRKKEYEEYNDIYVKEDKDATLVRSRFYIQHIYALI